MTTDNPTLHQGNINSSRVRIMVNIEFEAAGRFKLLSANTEFIQSRLPAWVLELGLRRGEIIQL